jgi:hypothetical protein
VAVGSLVVQNNNGCRSRSNSPTSGQPSLQFARLNDKRLRDVAGAIHYFDGRVLLAETMQKDPRRRVGIGMRVSEAAVTPFRR